MSASSTVHDYGGVYSTFSASQLHVVREHFGYTLLANKWRWSNVDRTRLLILSRDIESRLRWLRFDRGKRSRPVYCATSVQVKNPLVIEISVALHNGVSHNDIRILGRKI